MKPLLESILGLETERLRVEEWRTRNRCDEEALAPDPLGRRPPLCERCGSEACGRAEYVVMSDVLALRVGFRCAVEALLVRVNFAGARGPISIGVVQ
jgi:hypothetical protein